MTRPRTVAVTVATACFALAAGVGLGTGPLNGDNDKRLRSEVDDLQQQVSSLQERGSAAARADRFRDSFASTISPGLIEDTLAGRGVVLIALPGAKAATTKALKATVGKAGGSVTGVVRIRAKWENPHQRQFLEDLTSRLVTAGVKLPAKGTAYDRSGVLLSRALVASDHSSAGKTDPDATTILQGYRAGGLLAVHGSVPRADLALVVAPPGSTDGEASGRSVQADAASADGDAALAASSADAAWVSLATALDQGSSGVVVAGDASCATSGLIAALRADEDASDEVSTVDVADLAAGRVGAVWALAEQDRGGAGQYGAVDAADGALPSRPGSH